MKTLVSEQGILCTVRARRGYGISETDKQTVIFFLKNDDIGKPMPYVDMMKYISLNDCRYLQVLFDEFHANSPMGLAAPSQIPMKVGEYEEIAP